MQILVDIISLKSNLYWLQNGQTEWNCNPIHIRNTRLLKFPLWKLFIRDLHLTFDSIKWQALHLECEDLRFNLKIFLLKQIYTEACLYKHKIIYEFQHQYAIRPTETCTPSTKTKKQNPSAHTRTVITTNSVAIMLLNKTGKFFTESITIITKRTTS